ncbi:ferric reductase like transmembrane component-domain-containing protein [Clohesyomyces aquaticus]|uniref:ferric-chelate reductase (NADPH) n=1 Tax=Clohesyomyces aquaticus TaxID=1231657 RepID=A0A1Y2A9X2_9PLEO|nr:ferric reductase like transmembrane component-domain-containing protein [Clohesyomyces aquaticus]
MAAAWLTAPLQLHGSRMFECGDFTAEQCDYYKQHWHFWYIADYVFALPTIAFFMCIIGVFIIGQVLSRHVLGYRKVRGPPIWQKLIALVRYLSYRGFYVSALRWNSAPVGVLLLGLVGVIFFFCMDLAPQPYYWADIMFGGSPPLATRSGWMALACMPFVFATATKTNWITLVTGVSHERLQVFHRWISYAFFILALLHTFPFIVYHVRWHDMEMQFEMGLIFYWTGIVALIFQAWLTFMSHSTIRKFGYEFFKAMHLFAAVVFIVTFFWHCDYTLTSWDYFIATAAIYVPCYVYPWLRTCFEYGLKQKASIVVEENGFTRITIPANFDWSPGQHCFLRFTSFGLMNAMSAHPFTICSLPSTRAGEPSELVFYIRHQKGFTAKLYQHALEHPGAEVPVQVDGPYGGINEQRFNDGDHILVIAGGSGAGWILPFIERFLRSSVSLSDTTTDTTTADEEHGHAIRSSVSEKVVEKENGTRASHSQSPARRHGHSSSPVSLRVVLATRDTSSRIWFERTVASLLSTTSSSPNLSPSNLRVQVYLTGEAAAAQHVETTHTRPKHSTPEGSTSSADRISIPGETNNSAVPGKEFEGRPHLATIVHDEAAKVASAGQSLSVFVCGPTTMQNDVRNAVAKENLDVLSGKKRGGVYLHSEHFSWA